MSMLTLPYGTDSDVHLSSKEAIETAGRNNSFQYKVGFLATAEQYVAEEMEPLGIDSAWIWINPHASLFNKKLYVKESRNIYEISQKYKNLYPFGWFTYFEDENSYHRQDRLRRFFDEYGFCGVKINVEDTDYTGHIEFRLNESFIGPELEFISEHYPNKIVAFHTGINVAEKKAHPELVGKIAKKFSTLKYVMVHTGACPGPVVVDYHLDAITVMKENSNVHGILSMINSASVLDVYRAVRDGLINIEQVLVGSDYPFNKAIGTLESMYNLAFHPDLGFTEAQVRRIMSENATTLINQSF